jgi:hypothetical protein
VGVSVTGGAGVGEAGAGVFATGAGVGETGAGVGATCRCDMGARVGF